MSPCCIPLFVGFSVCMALCVAMFWLDTDDFGQRPPPSVSTGFTIAIIIIWIVVYVFLTSLHHHS